MEHDKSSDTKGGFEKYVHNFHDNAEGSISLKEFLEQVGRCGERVAGITGKRIYTGTQGLINEDSTHEEITVIYDDLITARSRGGTYDSDAYEWLYAETDEDGITPWRWTDSTVRNLNVKIKKLMRDAWNLLLVETQGANAWGIVQLTEDQPETGRLHGALKGLKEAYEDYVPHEKRTAKTRMQGLLAFNRQRGGTATEQFVALPREQNMIAARYDNYSDRGSPDQDPGRVYIDNQAAIAMLNKQPRGRNRHMDIRLKFLQLHADTETFDFLYIPTNDNDADLNTEVLSAPVFRALSRSVMGEDTQADGTDLIKDAIRALHARTPPRDDVPQGDARIREHGG
eukprot:g4004.t1